jgi:hypothetical protein
VQDGGVQNFKKANFDDAVEIQDFRAGAEIEVSSQPEKTRCGAF